MTLLLTFVDVVVIGVVVVIDVGGSGGSVVIHNYVQVKWFNVSSVYFEQNCQMLLTILV